MRGRKRESFALPLKFGNWILVMRKIEQALQSLNFHLSHHHFLPPFLLAGVRSAANRDEEHSVDASIRALQDYVDDTLSKINVELETIDKELRSVRQTLSNLQTDPSARESMNDVATFFDDKVGTQDERDELMSLLERMRIREAKKEQLILLLSR